MTLVRLLRRNATLFQAVFAVLWAVRLGAATHRWWVVEVTVVAAVAATVVAVRATRGLSARQALRTPEGRAFLRPVTAMTVAQLVASVVLPVAAAAAGADEWAVPLVAVTIGLFLVGFGRPLRLPAVVALGVAGALVPVAAGLPATPAVTSATMVAVLLTSLWWCAGTAAHAG